jgi:hypothetical protein
VQFYGAAPALKDLEALATILISMDKQ